MKVRKIIFQQTLILTFLMNCVVAIEELIGYLIYGTMFELQGYIPISLIAVAFLTSVPSVIFYLFPNISKGMAWLRLVLHFLMIYGIVLGSGYLFGWYHGTEGFIIMSVIYAVIYILVWVFTALLFKRDEQMINKALENLRDEE